MRVLSELRRRNVLRMAVLYAIAAWLIMQVTEVLMSLVGLPQWSGQAILAVLAVGFPIALAFSWFYELTPEGITLEKDVDRAESITHVTGRRLDFVVISLLAAAVLVFAYDKWWLSDDLTPPLQNSVAVLPFTNISGDPDDEYLSDGITETLLHALAQLPDCKVPARTSSYYFKGQDIDIREIASQLGVAYVLEGSVQRAGNKLRIVAQLIEAQTGFHRWSKTYDRDMSDIFAVQDNIATNVARALQATLSGDPGQGGGKIQTVGTDNVAAYEAYLIGMQQKNKFSNKFDLLAETSFKEALALDPDFFEARLGLAFTYRHQADNGAITPAEANEKLIPLVDRLREERPDNGLVLLAAFTVENFRARRLGGGAVDVDKRLAQLSAAIERTPNEPVLYMAMANMSRLANRLEESIEWEDRAIAVDPLSWGLYFLRGDQLFQIGDLDGAEAAYARALELNPDNPSLSARLGDFHRMRKQFAQWFAHVRKGMDLDPLDVEFPGYLSMDLLWFGLIDEAYKYLQRAIEIDPDQAMVRNAKLYRLLLQDHARARDMSEAMLRADIVNRWDAYWLAAIGFVSTMTELGETDQALAVLEELQPRVTSPDFAPQNGKQRVLQYAAVLAMAQSQSREDTLRMLDVVVPRWDQSFPNWRQGSGREAAIEMARGETKLAIEHALKDLSVKNLVDAEEAVIYRHLYFWQALAQQPAVAARLSELDAEMKKGGEEIWDYIVAHDLQL